MTGHQYINLAKTYYSVEMFLPDEIMVRFLNLARQRVNRLMNATYGEYSFTTTANECCYALQKPFERLFRVSIVEGRITRELTPIATGDFPFKESLKARPIYYSFIPPSIIEFYPTPNSAYKILVYGTPSLFLTYTTTNLSTNDTDIPDSYAEAVSIDIAKRLAMLDQQYELTGLLESMFLTKLQESKI